MDDLGGASQFALGGTGTTGTGGGEGFALPVMGDAGVLTTTTIPVSGFAPGIGRFTIPAFETRVFPPGTVFDQPVVIRSGPQAGQTIPAGVPLQSIAAVTAFDAIPTLPVNVVRGAFKVAENETPRPVDRLYVTYNYFSDVLGSLNPGLQDIDVNRTVFGFEKTFFNGNASVGLRVPILQITGDDFTEQDGFGDISVLFKFLFWADDRPMTGNILTGGSVFSGGLLVTAPSGGSVTFTSLMPEVHPTMLQPWLGGRLAGDRAFMQFFSSVAVPTDDRDTTFFFNDVQLGYILYENRCSWLSSIVPVFEVHVNTPLNNRGIRDVPVGSSDIVNLLGGVFFGIGRRGTLGLNVGAPVTGPRPNELEAGVLFNYRF